MRWYKTVLLILCAAAIASGCARLNLKSVKDRDNWSVEKFYSEASQALKKKRWDLAIEFYQAMEARYPFGPYTDQAHIDTIYAHYKNEQPEAAIAAADRFIRLHPTHQGVPYAYYMKGLVNFNEYRGFLDRWIGSANASERDPSTARGSFLAFKELVTRYPDSQYSENARQRMAYLLNVLAMHDVRVAQYYLRRGANVAVVNRCKYVINEYQRTPAVEHALGLMVTAYRRMGMDQLADDSLRVLELNFPGSTYLVKGARSHPETPQSWMSRFFRHRSGDS